MARPPEWTPVNAARFRDHSVASAYHLRRPYPPELFNALMALIANPDLPLLLLSTGDIARPLAPFVARVDAVDSPNPSHSWFSIAKPASDVDGLRRHWYLNQSRDD